MTGSAVDYTSRGTLAFITLNRPKRLNAINRALISGLEEAVHRANGEPDVRVIILRGAGRAFCAGYDLETAPEAELAAEERTGGWGPGRGLPGHVAERARLHDLVGVSQACHCSSARLVRRRRHGHGALRRPHLHGRGCAHRLSTRPHLGYTNDVHVGVPPGLEHAKRLMLTGEAVDGLEAERLGLVSRAVPADRLADEVESFAAKLATTPTNQLVMTKLLVNQAYENMELRTTQTLGTLLDGVARHTPEGRAWRDLAPRERFKEAVRRRDEPWGDYSARTPT